MNPSHLEDPLDNPIDPKKFHWGVACAAYQVEGAYQIDDKGPSIWDKFANTPGKIYKNQHANQTCQFYHRYPEDLQIVRDLQIPNFRFSLSWSRLLPEGTGKVNSLGIDFYNRLINHCLSLGITPWVTLYHWDLPLALHQKGGWTNREIVHWFSEYVALAVKHFGDRVQHWMVMNEPMVFTGAGYFLGIHAPGKRGMANFLAATHHATLCQAEGARVIKAHRPQAEVGTTFSCSYLEPYKDSSRHINATIRADAVVNRLFIEPSLGMGYPTEQFKTLARIEKYMQAGDEDRMTFDFDFYGIQNYTREIIRHAWAMPYIFARPVGAKHRNVPITLMEWEVYPEAIYRILKQFHRDYGLKKVIITENGAAFQDTVEDGKVKDELRTQFLQANIRQCLRAKQEGVPLEGYFVWTLTDNFEWAEGYRPTFGLVHIDFQTQQRTVKDSAYWYSQFIQEFATMPIDNT